MNPDDYNKWLLIPGGGGILAFLVWFLSKTRLGVKVDSAQGEGIDSILKLSKESMGQKDEAEQRAKAASAALYIEQQANLELRGEVQLLRQEVANLRSREAETREIVSRLAKLLVERDPKVKPFVQQWINDSGYPPLES